jgi:hypothetical protein
MERGQSAMLEVGERSFGPFPRGASGEEVGDRFGGVERGSNAIVDAISAGIERVLDTVAAAGPPEARNRQSRRNREQHDSGGNSDRASVRQPRSLNWRRSAHCRCALGDLVPASSPAKASNRIDAIGKCAPVQFVI